MFSNHYSCPCLVLIFCLIAMWCGNSYMLSSKVGKSIYKGLNASGLCLSIPNASRFHKISAQDSRFKCMLGVGVILSGRLMGNNMIRSVLTSNGLCVRRCGNRILDLGYISLCSIIGSACIKVGIVW